MKMIKLIVAAFTLASAVQLYSQGYIVPNGVVYSGFQVLGYEIDVLHDPANSYYTGFILVPKSANKAKNTSFNV